MRKVGRGFATRSMARVLRIELKHAWEAGKRAKNSHVCTNGYFMAFSSSSHGVVSAPPVLASPHHMLHGTTTNCPLAGTPSRRPYQLPPHADPVARRCCLAKYSRSARTLYLVTLDHGGQSGARMANQCCGRSVRFHDRSREQLVTLAGEPYRPKRLAVWTAAGIAAVAVTRPVKQRPT